MHSQHIDQDKDKDHEAGLATPDEAISHDPNNLSERPREEKQEPLTHQIAPPPPDGGYGWVCTICCATINAHTWGMNSAYGVFLAYYLQNNLFPGATSLEYALIGSLSISMAMLISPIATLTTRYYGTKTTLFIGIFLQTASFQTASLATQIWHLFLSQGLCFGFGMGFLFVGSVGIPAQWFTKRRSLANGIAASGSGFGGLIYSLAAGAMLQSVGLAWTFRVLGIVACVVNGVCAILVRDRNFEVGSRQNAFDYRLFQRAEYLLLCAYAWFSILAYVVLIFSLANYANSIGLDASHAAIVSALLNLGQALGRPPVGYFSDGIGRLNMAALMTAAAGLFTFAIWIPAQSFSILVFFALIGGAVAGTFWATISPLAAEIGGLPNLASALNLIWLVIVLPCTFSEPIALEIVRDMGGEYFGTQIFVGVMYFAAAICLMLLRGWKIGEVNELKRIRELRRNSSLGPNNDDDDNDDNEEEDKEKTAQIARKQGRRRILMDFAKWRKV